jgi:D-tyrosyl-tRNA(Tyr) deacylase
MSSKAVRVFSAPGGLLLSGRRSLRAVVQRVSSAAVAVGGKDVSRIGRGLLVLVGVMKGDTETVAGKMADKIAAMRIFADDAGKMNLSVGQVGGDVIAVSQFTLCAETKKGNRPGFDPAEAPERANQLYEHFCKRLEIALGKTVGRGVFGADMKVSIVNDGPVTFVVEINA